MAALKQNFFRLHNVFGIHCTCYDIIFVTAKRLLRTQIFEIKGFLSSEKKRCGSNFSHFIEYHKPDGTNYKGPEGNFTLLVQVIISFLQDLRN